MSFDPSVAVNFDEVADSTPVEAGEYALQAKVVEVKETKDGEGVNVRVMWIHTDPDFASSAPVSDYFTWRDPATEKGRKTMGFTKRKIKAVLGEAPSLSPNDFAEAVKGREVRALLKQEAYTKTDGTSGVSNKIVKYL